MDPRESWTWKEWLCTCKSCVLCCEYLWESCCRCFYGESRHRSPTIRKEDITYILQQSDDHASGVSDNYSEGGPGERHGSFTSCTASITSGHSGRDLKAEHYSQIEARRASSLSASAGVRKESTAPLIDLKSIDFWSGVPRGESVQPKLLSPGRRDTIGSQGSADQIRPDLYDEHPAQGTSASWSGHQSTDDGLSCPSENLGSLHFYLHYDAQAKTMSIRIIEGRDFPRPITLDSSKQDQAHSNPYVKICLLPNQKESRQTSLRKKTQNPRFDENFLFEIPYRELQRRTLQLVVKDFDKYSRHRVVGQVLLPCADLNVLKGIHLWKPLQAVQSIAQEDLGEILFSLCYLPAAGRLNVDILRAKQLLPTDLVGGAAPYVRVSLVLNERHLKTKKTSYKKCTLDPVFNESLSFDINSVQLQDCCVVISVLDFNGGVAKDTFIGRVVLGKEASGRTYSELGVQVGPDGRPTNWDKLGVHSDYQDKSTTTRRANPGNCISTPSNKVTGHHVMDASHGDTKASWERNHRTWILNNL